MIPVKLSIAGFLSYKEGAELDFSDFQIACVSGANGAGKSTLFDAITWALFGVARSRDDSLINHASKQAEVVFDFSYEAQNYRVQRIKTRDKTALLAFYVKQDDGQFAVLTEHSLRETQKQIEETLKLDYETFINAAFFLQGKADLFTQQTPGDRKRILSTILGLDQWEQYRINAAEMRRNMEMDTGTLSGRLSNIKDELADEDNRKAQLKQLSLEKEAITNKRKEKESVFEQARLLAESIQNQQEMRDMLASQELNLQHKIEQIQTRVQNRQQEIEHFENTLKRQKEIEQGTAQWRVAVQQVSETQKKAAEYHALMNRVQASQMEIDNQKNQLGSELDQLENNEAEIKRLEEQTTKQQADLDQLLIEITNLSAEVAAQESLEAQTAVIREQIQQYTAENNQLKQRMQELKEKIDLINHQEGGQCPLCTQPLDQEHREQILAAYTEEGKQYGDAFRCHQAAIQDQEAQLRALEINLTSIKKSLDLLHQKQRTADQLQYQQNEAQNRVQGWQKEPAARLLTVREMLSKDQFAPEARETIINTNKALEKLAFQPDLLTQLEEQVEQLQVFEAQNNELQKALSAIEPLRREISESTLEIEQTQKELQTIHQNWQEIDQKLAVVRDQVPDIKNLQKELDQMRTEENRVQMALGGALQKVEVLDSLKAQKKQIQQEISQQNHQISALKRLEQAFSKDGVPALLIEQALPDIEEEANKILERLSDGMMSVQFNTQSAYKDKKRSDKKETLDILISDNAGPRPYEMYSGGEAFRVNFAIRLALSKVLARRAGARLQTLVIDEGFGSQDAVGRQRLVEVINLIRSDFEKILIITHLEELKDSFSARIEVEKSDTGSMIKVVTNI